MKKQNNGITLIALVITIIVLLILAGVTIATLTGQNGILKKANDAKTETTKAGAKEQAQIAIMASYDSEGKLDYEKLKENLENIGVTGIPDEKTFPLTATIDGENIEIKEDGTVELAFHAEEWDKTACKESCFLWESDDPNSGEAYHTIIGYTTEIANEIKLKIPSRCQKIYCNNVNWNDEGRVFAVDNFYNVELPRSLVEIGYYAFASFKFNSVNIPNSVKIIGDHAFYNSRDRKY